MSANLFIHRPGMYFHGFIFWTVHTFIWPSQHRKVNAYNWNNELIWTIYLSHSWDSRQNTFFSIYLCFSFSSLSISQTDVSWIETAPWNKKRVMQRMWQSFCIISFKITEDTKKFIEYIEGSKIRKNKGGGKDLTRKIMTIF